MKLHVLLYALFTLITIHSANSQVVESGDLEEKIKDLIDVLPAEEDDDYQKPSDLQFATWGSMLEFLLDGDYVNAAAVATTIDYDLIRFTDDDTGRIYYILENSNSNFWETYVFYPDYLKTLIVQSPHPKKDFNTGRQGAHVFKNTDAMFFFLARTNRCNQTAKNFLYRNHIGLWSF